MVYGRGGHFWEICPYWEVQMSECMCVRVQKPSLKSRTLTSLFFSVLQAMVETVNNLLQVRSQVAWRELSVAEQLRCATMLLDTVETGAFMLADNLLKTDTIQESTDNIREFTKQVLEHAKRMFTRNSLCTYFIELIRFHPPCLLLLVLISPVMRKQKQVKQQMKKKHFIG